MRLEFGDTALSDWTLAVKNLLFPIYCRSCGERLLTEENPCFCPTCWEMSPRVERPFCIRCGAPQRGREGFGAPQNFTCARCRTEPPQYLRRIYAAATYAGAVSEAIQLLKFHEKRPMAEHLGGLLQQFAVQEMERNRYNCIVPVPLHPVRKRDRGFNQSELLAYHAAKVFPDAVVCDALERIRPTAVQSRIRENKQRRANVRDAFYVVDTETIKNGTLLLVDDVVTTGHTVEECARTLLEAGAYAVDVLTVAIPVNEDTLPTTGQR